MEKVLHSMNIHPDFINLVSLLYKDNKVHLKTNGFLGPAHPTFNGVKQGCGLSPLLYICVFQSLLSLLKKGTHTHPPIEGVSIPGPMGIIQLRACAFADDLMVFLKGRSHLRHFRTLLEIHERGSGMKLEWPKTLGYDIGPSLHSPEALPPGWSNKDIDFSQPCVRILGAFLGTPEHIAQQWEHKTTHHMKTKFAEWQERAMPNSFTGKNLVIKNSVLACAWYLVQNQAPPDLDSAMDNWQQMAWHFLINPFTVSVFTARAAHV